jgi:hypothetical protein
MSFTGKLKMGFNGAKDWDTKHLDNEAFEGRTANYNSEEIKVNATKCLSSFPEL